jgi:DNA helicase-2/ATP-dependent DNA helicase PcrA
MKGLECNIIFSMGADDETFPNYRAMQKDGAGLLQEKNNTYVTFARARRFLYISYSVERHVPWGRYKNYILLFKKIFNQ